MHEKIQELIKNNPKAYVRLISNNPEMRSWVETNSKISSDNWPKKIYSALTGESFICPNDNEKKLKSIHLGTMFCGKARTCKCARDQISQKMSNDKNSYTDDKKKKIAEKRAATNLDRYGVENVGQTSIAKINHKNYYSNIPKKIREPKDIKKIGYDQLSDYVLSHFNFMLITPFEQYHGIRQKDAHEYEFQCCKCQNKIRKKFYHGRGLRCENCDPIVPVFKSGEENEVFAFITNLDIKGIQRDRKLINPYELDMIFPDHKIAIEYCGLYWHSESSANKNKNYHANKLKLVEAKGWRLITIFSDEWNKSRVKVENRLRNIFKKTQIKIAARNCKIEEITPAESRSFFDMYHIQNNAVAKIHIGLKYKGELVAAMTFGSGRKALNTKKDQNVYELVRFATNGANIQGGASRLLNYFVKKYNPSKIISYSDCRWSRGELYKSLGFISTGQPSIGYWYVSNYENRHHRYNFTKQKLIKNGNDKNLTEWQIMQKLKYDRIWDCGQQKWSWTP